MLFLSVFTAGMAASVWVAFTILFASYFPLAQVGRSMGLIFFFTRLSQAVTNYAGGAIAERWGWQGPFYAGAVLSLLGSGGLLADSAGCRSRWGVRPMLPRGPDYSPHAPA